MSTHPNNPDSEQIEAFLRQRLGRTAREIRVLLRCDGVVLTGRVESWYGKQLAQHLARQLIGKPVSNEIEVHSSPHRAQDE